MAWKSGISPHYKRLMTFIDGSNLLIQLSKLIDIEFRAEKPPFSALHLSSFILKQLPCESGFIKIRQYWFASYKGDDSFKLKYCKELRKFHFEPMLFKKKNGKEKGVDISLTMNVLTNAFNRNYDIAYIIAGDEDYLGLVREAKRYGTLIHGAFFNEGLSEGLELEFDNFYKLNHTLQSDRGKELISYIKKEILDNNANSADAKSRAAD